MLIRLASWTIAGGEVGIRALHASGHPDPTGGARAVPASQKTSFVFERPGIDTTFAAADRSEAFAAAMRAAARAFSHTGAGRGFVFGVAARSLSQVV